MRSASILALAILTGCASQPPLSKATQSGLPEATFRNATPEVIRNELALSCAKTGGIVESTTYSITCAKRNDSGRGFMAQAMLGNACSDTPFEKVEFTTVPAGPDVMVTARGWMEIKMCFGDRKRIEYDKNNSFRNMAQAGLDQAVARWDAMGATAPAQTPVPAVPRAAAPATPQRYEPDPAKRCDACQRIGKP